MSLIHLSSRCALLGLIGLTLCGCGGGANDAPAAPAVAAAAPADKTEKIAVPPAGWDAANTKSAEHYRAGNYAESIAVLEAFAKAHPDFPDVELMLGDNWWTMPRTATTAEPERLARASGHLRRGMQLATDDYGRDWGAKSLFRVCEKAYLSDSLQESAKRQLITEARNFADDFLQKHPTDPAALSLKSQLLDLEARLAAKTGTRKNP